MVNFAPTFPQQDTTGWPPTRSYRLPSVRTAPFVRIAYLQRGIEGVNAALLRRTVNVEDVLSQYGAVINGPGVIHGPLIIHNAHDSYANLYIGANAHIGRGVVLDLADRIELGRDVTVSMGVTLLTHFDVGDRPLGEKMPARRSRLAIGSGAYIGANATVLPGCHIGAAAVVGAGAVVTRPIEDHQRVAGVPARPL